MNPKSAESHLPLTPLTLGILTALAEKPGSGYGIVRSLEEGSEGRLSPGTGTVYVALQRLMARGLVGAADDPPGAPQDNRERRWYELTPLGRTVLALEVRRLAGTLRVAIRAGVLSAQDFLEP